MNAETDTLGFAFPAIAGGAPIFQLAPAPEKVPASSWIVAVGDIFKTGAAAYAGRLAAKTEREYIRAGLTAPGSVLLPQVPAGMDPALFAPGAPPGSGSEFFSRHGGTVLAVAATAVVVMMFAGKTARSSAR